MPIEKKIGKQNPVQSIEESVYLNLRRSTWKITSQVNQTYANEKLTSAQYNALRILRGHHPNPMTATQIGDLMVSKDSDLTRILGHLETRKLIARTRSKQDKRKVLVSITDTGLETLQRMDEPVVKAIRSVFCHLSQSTLKQLNTLLEELDLE